MKNNIKNIKKYNKQHIKISSSPNINSNENFPSLVNNQIHINHIKKSKL